MTIKIYINCPELQLIGYIKGLDRPNVLTTKAGAQGFLYLKDAVMVAYRNRLKLNLSFETMLLLTKLYKEHCNVDST